MRRFVVFGMLLASALLSGCVAATGKAQSSREVGPETLLRWDFAGTKQLATYKELKPLNDVLALPQTAALSAAAAEHLALRAAARFNKAGNTNVNAEIARAIQPLLADIWQAESRLQLVARGGQDADWLFALRLDAARSEEWSKALAQLAKAAGMQGDAGGANWTARKENYRLSFSRNKDWTLIEGGFGAPDPKIAKEFRSRLGRRRGKQILTAELNGPLLAKFWNSEILAQAPKLSLSAAPRADGLRTELTMDYAEDIGIQPEEWNVPMSLITEPLIGFTAVQGVQKKLATLEKVKALQPEQIPNQVFVWAQSLTPFSVSFAAEVKNPAEVVTNTARLFKEVKLPMGYLNMPTNRPVLFWEELPIKPFIDAPPAPDSSFLRGGLFPVQQHNEKPAPPELFAQLKKKNVIYYEWEITGARMRQFAPLWQLYYLIGGLPTNIEAPSFKWIGAAGPKLGNTITEGTLENSRRIKLVRQSYVGFNAIELILLVHLLDKDDIVYLRSRGGAPAPGLRLPSMPR